MPKAFVIMPFSDTFDDIFTLFISETLRSCDYEVFRADDINNSQNILSDIVQAIASSDLIVADLTGANPNVFYELGIAHALNRPTIMLTQDIEDLPFDLRSYRAISYSTDFVKIRDAKDQLSRLAIDASAGRVQFGNPVSDFSVGVLNTHQSTKIEGDAGLLDHMADLESSLEELTSVFLTLAQETLAIGAKTEQASSQFERLSGSANERRHAVKGYALELTNYSNTLNRLNSAYGSALFKHEGSINNIFSSATLIKSQGDRDGMVALLESMHGSETGTSGFLTQARGLCETIEAGPDIERTFIFARNATTKELRALIQLLEKTISVFSRSRALGNGLIADFDAKHSGGTPAG